EEKFPLPLIVDMDGCSRHLVYTVKTFLASGEGLKRKTGTVGHDNNMEEMTLIW
ncbi:Hypothetical protein FKW44_017922, partial [Caligus rogercresseyi]